MQESAGHSAHVIGGQVEMEWERQQQPLTPPLPPSPSLPQASYLQLANLLLLVWSRLDSVRVCSTTDPLLHIARLGSTWLVPASRASPAFRRRPTEYRFSGLAALLASRRLLPEVRYGDMGRAEELRRIPEHDQAGHTAEKCQLTASLQRLASVIRVASSHQPAIHEKETTLPAFQTSL